MAIFTAKSPGADWERAIMSGKSSSFNQPRLTISFWIFKQVYGSGAIGGTGSYGLVSAAGLCFTLVGVPLIMFTRWLLNKIPVVEY